MTFANLIELGIDYFLRDSNSKSSRVASSKGDLTKIINDFVIRPTIIIDKSLKDNNYLKYVISYQVSFFTAVYGNVLSHLIQIHGVEPSVAIELLSENYDYVGALEDYDFDMCKILTNAKEEAIKETLLIAGLESGEQRELDEKISAMVERHVMIPVSFIKEGAKMELKIPINIMAKIIYTDVNGILVSSSKEDTQNSFDRIDDLRAGTIRFWQDFIFATDQIKDYGKRKLADKDGVLSDKRKREYDAFIKGFDKGYVGFGKYYRMIICSESVEKALVQRYRSKLEKAFPKIKDDFSILSLSVIDTIHERLKIFSGSFDGSLNLRLKDIKKKSKNEEMEDLLKIIVASSRSSGRVI